MISWWEFPLLYSWEMRILQLPSSLIQFFPSLFFGHFWKIVFCLESWQLGHGCCPRMITETSNYMLEHLKWYFNFKPNYESIATTPGPEVDDINTMNRYRDAIVYQNSDHPNYERTMFGAYVLFPTRTRQSIKIIGFITVFVPWISAGCRSCQMQSHWSATCWMIWF